MIKLSIIIPQYKESEEMLKRLLNSIDNQKQVNFKELEIIIVNDCSDFCPSDNIGKKYPFKVRVYRTKKNEGPGRARQLGVSKAKGDYLLFLDADDCLISCIALRYVMNYQGHADIIRAKFFNENLNTVDNGWTWVHGKFYKKAFLNITGLKFPKGLKVNEDAYFNMLAGSYASEIEEIDEIITFWAKNPNSLTRENTSEFVVNCFDDFLKGKLLGFRKLKENGYIESLKANLLDLFVYSYYYFQTREFFRGDNKVQKKLEKYKTTIAKIIEEFKEEFSTFTETDFDSALSSIYTQFSNYVDYRPRQTFDNFREEIYKIGD